MPPPYRNPHWQIFSATRHVAAGSVGYIPADWAASHGLNEIPAGAIPLPQQRLDRAQVRSICQNPTNPVLFGYICAMAWGLQGAGPGGRGHVASAWNARETIAAHLTALRCGSLSRCEAYNLFLGAGDVPGLGPSYFTKLLYFFHPKADCYIMDQWTGKSVDLLTGNWVVRMAGNAPSTMNKCGNYAAYCEEVDEIARLLGVTGEQAEEMMMSKGGRRPWPWRAYVRANWPVNAPGSPYNRAVMSSIYPKIPSACF